MVAPGHLVQTQIGPAGHQDRPVRLFLVEEAVLPFHAQSGARAVGEVVDDDHMAALHLLPPHQDGDPFRLPQQTLRTLAAPVQEGPVLAPQGLQHLPAPDQQGNAAVQLPALAGQDLVYLGQVPAAEICPDLLQGHPQIFQGHDEGQPVQLYGRVKPIAFFVHPGRTEQADLVIVVQGLFVHPRQFGKGRCGQILHFQRKIPP